MLMAEKNPREVISGLVHDLMGNYSQFEIGFVLGRLFQATDKELAGGLDKVKARLMEEW